ncbi:MAG: hypothetical protein ABIS38_09330 [Sphingomicrobium sp.]
MVHHSRHCPISRRATRNLPAGASLYFQMNSDRPTTAAEFDMDREIIRVDIPPAYAGITAALRRAFAAAATEPCDRDFAEILRKLH